MTETATTFGLDTTRVVFGAGASEETGEHLAQLGITRALVVCDAFVSSSGLAEQLQAALGKAGVESGVFDRISGEPSEDSVADARDAARQGYDGFIGVGGGSALDTAKLCALFATHAGELLDYVNAPIGRGIPVPGPILPLVALPTTSGTGSEVTTVAVIDFPRLGTKTGVSHRHLRPTLAIVDPALTVSCPPGVTAATGIDALMHALEAYTVSAYDTRARLPLPQRPPYQGANPYSDKPSEFPDDPAFERMGANWRETTTVYGPVFTLASEGHAVVARDSPAAAAWLYKGLGALAMLVLTGLAAFLARETAFAAAFVGWNPLLAVHFAGGGHNDAWMMALVLGALALGAVGKRQWAGAAWVGAIAIKWVAVVFLPLRALEARAQGRRVGHLGFAAAAVVVAALATWRYGTGWLEAFGPLAKNLREGAHYSLPSRLASLGVPHDAAVALFAVLFALAYLWLLRDAWRGRARLGLCADLVLVATPWLIAWYAVWAVPLAAAEEDRAARLLALGLCAYLLRNAVPL